MLKRGALPVGAALVRDAQVKGRVAHEGLVLDGAKDRPGAAGQEVGALAFLDGQAVDGARRIVGTAAHDGEGFEAGNRAGADDGTVGGEVTEPTARDTETVEDLVIKVAAARGEQAGGRGDRTRPADDAGEAVREVVRQEQGSGDALCVGGVFLQVGEKLVRRVDGGRLVAGQVEELAVADAIAESVKGAGGTLVAVGNNVANELTVLVEGSPVHAPCVNGDSAGVRELFESLLQAGNRLGLHRCHIPREGAIFAAAGLVLKAVDVRDVEASVVQRSGEDSSGCGSKVNSKYGGH